MKGIPKPIYYLMTSTEISEKSESPTNAEIWPGRNKLQGAKPHQTKWPGCLGQRPMVCAAGCTAPRSGASGSPGNMLWAAARMLLRNLVQKLTQGTGTVKEREVPQTNNVFLASDLCNAKSTDQRHAATETAR